MTNMKMVNVSDDTQIQNIKVAQQSRVFIIIEKRCKKRKEIKKTKVFHYRETIDISIF